MTIAVEQKPPHPVFLDVEYPARVSRLTTFFRLFMAIPQFIVIYLLLMAMGLITVLAWFAILFTGRYPKSFFEFTSGVMRWQANVWAYVALLRDEYPPFSWEPGEYPLALDIPPAERQSRFRLFIRLFAVIPNQIVLQFVMYGWFFTTFLSWWMILFTGRYPRGLFRFGVGVLRWQMRQFSYLYLLRDEYPPYSVNANARPGNEVVSAVLGLPILLLYFGWVAFTAASPFRSSAHTDVVLDSATIERDHPSLRSGSLRLTLLDYGKGSASGGMALATFKMRAEHDGIMPTSFWAYSFELDTCEGNAYGVGRITGSSSADWFFFVPGHQDFTLYFRIAPLETPCYLDYVSTSRMTFHLVSSTR